MRHYQCPVVPHVHSGTKCPIFSHIYKIFEKGSIHPEKSVLLKNEPQIHYAVPCLKEVLVHGAKFIRVFMGIWEYLLYSCKCLRGAFAPVYLLSLLSWARSLRRSRYENSRARLGRETTPLPHSDIWIIASIVRACWARVSTNNSSILACKFKSPMTLQNLVDSYIRLKWCVL